MPQPHGFEEWTGDKFAFGKSFIVGSPNVLLSQHHFFDHMLSAGKLETQTCDSKGGCF
jgi:hypothetical protein